MSENWGETFREIADGWLFEDVPGELPAAAVLPLENPDLYDRKQWHGLIEVEHEYRSVTVGRHQGTPLAVFTPKLGAPAAAMLIEAAARRGVRTLLGLGYCGGIADRLHCGELFAPYAALPGDGTSAALAPARYPAVADRALTARLHSCHAGLHDGLVHSLDAVFAQDDALIRRCRELAVDALDMETAAVLTTARLRGVRAATVLVVSDHPGRGDRTEGALIGAGTARAARLALEVLSGC